MKAEIVECGCVPGHRMGVLDSCCADCGLTEAEVANLETIPPCVNRGPKRELDGQSGLPRFNRYSIPERPDPRAVDCPYCVRRPRNLEAHIRAVHPDRLARDWR